MTEKILFDLGVNRIIPGFTYLVEAVERIVQRGNENYILTKEIYPGVADKYRTSVKGVSEAIRRTIKSSKCSSLTASDIIAQAVSRVTKGSELILKGEWTKSEDDFILNNLNALPKDLAHEPILRGRSIIAIRHRIKYHQGPKKVEKILKSPLPVSGVTLGQILKIHGRKCEVVYIHPEGLFYQVIFANGIIETINRHEYGQTPYISWLSRKFWA